MGGQLRPEKNHLPLSTLVLSKWLHVFNDNPMLEHLSGDQRDISHPRDNPVPRKYKKLATDENWRQWQDVHYRATL